MSYIKGRQGRKRQGEAAERGAAREKAERGGSKEEAARGGAGREGGEGGEGNRETHGRRPPVKSGSPGPGVI